MDDKETRRVRRRLKRKHKARDRYKGKPWVRIVQWIHRHFEKDYTFNRRKSHAETGYGVAYEDNPDADKY